MSSLYKWSKDYEYLWDAIHFADDHGWILAQGHRTGIFEVYRSHDGGYQIKDVILWPVNDGEDDIKQRFISHCQEMDMQFLPPTVNIYR